MASSHYEKYGRKWYEANKESELQRGKEYYQKSGKQKKLESYPERRNRILKSRYGITLEDYDNFFRRQGGCCAICSQPSKSTFHIDHCHTTGKVRGLLCGNCNRGLGYFKDDAGRLQQAIKYLDITGHGGSCGV